MPRSSSHVNWWSHPLEDLPQHPDRCASKLPSSLKVHLWHISSTKPSIAHGDPLFFLALKYAVFIQYVLTFFKLSGCSY